MHRETNTKRQQRYKEKSIKHNIRQIKIQEFK